MSKVDSIKIQSDITVFMKYARYIENKQRRENWKELCHRDRDMLTEKYPNLHSEIVNVFNDFIIPKKVLPSMRSMQFAGKPIEVNPVRIFNCSYLPIDHYKGFSETMFLLLSGTGVGYSVQRNHVDLLPTIMKPLKSRRYYVEDSIEGWADAVKRLMMSYFKGKSLPIFDFRGIRKKGERLITSGGKAPGHEPLKKCLNNLQMILDRKDNGSKLTPLEVHDIQCFIADCVLSGGIRRAACISFFDISDEEMLSCKSGNWWELNPQRGRSNNSAVALRYKITREVFDDMWSKTKASGSGEPAICFTNDYNILGNPCYEISLKPFQMCNLTEINFSNVKSQEDLNERAIAASFIGTLQAGFTDFHYLRDIWKKTTEKEALIGVSGTGICSGEILKYDEKEAALLVVAENERVANIIGINKAARCTAIKPSGTTSLVLGTSSGIHAWFAPYYIRRIRVGKNESIYKYLVDNHPELIEDEFFKPETQAIITIPIKAPTGGIFRDESPLDMLDRIKRFSENWVNPGHRSGSNTHNISATVSIKDDEWKVVGDWMWKNREVYNGISVLPYDGGTYTQPPFEEITKYKYDKLIGSLSEVNLDNIVELDDETDLSGELACVAGSCEIK